MTFAGDLETMIKGIFNIKNIMFEIIFNLDATEENIKNCQAHTNKILKELKKNKDYILFDNEQVEIRRII